MDDQNKDDLLRTILPYTEIVGQDKLKLALELAYISPRISGVLISGQRGTAKSTTVRAFAIMIMVRYQLPFLSMPVKIALSAVGKCKSLSIKASLSGNKD